MPGSAKQNAIRDIYASNLNISLDFGVMGKDKPLVLLHLISLLLAFLCSKQTTESFNRGYYIHPAFGKASPEIKNNLCSLFGIQSLSII